YRLDLILECAQESRAILFREARIVGLAASRFPEMTMEIPHAERESDTGFRERLAGGRNHARALVEATRGERDVGRARDVALRDPVGGRIGAIANDNDVEERVRARSQATVAHHMDGKAVARGDTLRFPLYRACVAVDEEFKHVSRRSGCAARPAAMPLPLARI